MSVMSSATAAKPRSIDAKPFSTMFVSASILPSSVVSLAIRKVFAFRRFAEEEGHHLAEVVLVLMAHPLRRRKFLALVGGAAAWPVSVRAQQKAARIGFLPLGSPSNADDVLNVEAFRLGLR